MEIYNVGPDDINYEFETMDTSLYEWMVVWYENGGYDGSGEAMALGKDGHLYYQNLGHCSCYGPMESWPQQDFIVAELFGETANVLNSPFTYGCVEEKVRKLLGK
jgi:hypothetical protein